jgi:UDP:flavonoid glycosyltransferase YjiC (YdhE family)
MKKILVLPYGPALSHVSRTLLVAKVLRALQHEVVFASDGDFMRLPREAGFRVLPLKVLDKYVLADKTHQGRMDWYDDVTLAEHVAAELELFEEIKPDLVLSDFRTTAGTSAELAGIPSASILNASWTNYCSAHSKAPGKGAPHRSVLRRALAGCAKPFSKLRRAKKLADEGSLFGIRKCLSLIADCAEFTPGPGLPPSSPYLWDLRTGAEPFHRLRRAKRLPDGGNLFDFMEGDVTLIADCPEFWPARNLPDNFHYVGPIAWEPEIAPPAWLERLDPARPTIYVTMGA